MCHLDPKQRAPTSAGAGLGSLWTPSNTINHKKLQKRTLSGRKRRTEFATKAPLTHLNALLGKCPIDAIELASQ